MKLVRKAAYWAAFLTMGPITGPLIEGVYRNWRKQERALAGLYGVAVVTTFIGLPCMLALVLRWLEWATALT